MIVGFGIRNFEHIEKALAEIRRVLKKRGVFAILEFSKPEKFPVKNIYSFYSNKILPLAGKIISKDKAAYTYLPESVKEFPSGSNFLNLLENEGFMNNRHLSLSYNIASVYLAEKE